jgi:hypothetical protein
MFDQAVFPSMGVVAQQPIGASGGQQRDQKCYQLLDAEINHHIDAGELDRYLSHRQADKVSQRKRQQDYPDQDAQTVGVREMAVPLKILHQQDCTRWKVNCQGTAIQVQVMLDVLSPFA